MRAAIHIFQSEYCGGVNYLGGRAHPGQPIKNEKVTTLNGARLIIFLQQSKFQLTSECDEPRLISFSQLVINFPLQFAQI